MTQTALRNSVLTGSYPTHAVWRPALSWTAWQRPLALLVGITLLVPSAEPQDKSKPTVDPAARQSAEQLFAERIWPVVQTKCLPCHGEGKELSGGLDLRTLAGTQRGGDSGEPAIADRPKESLPIWRAIMRGDAEYSAMPPKENDRLSAEQLSGIATWLSAGAPWPDAARRQEIVAMKRTTAAANTIRIATSGGLSSEWTNRSYQPADVWAYRPLQASELPANPGEHSIDGWILRRLKELALPPAPRADRRTLIRRATFDLIGLPPTVDEVAEFLADTRSDDEAFAAVVDRLLASPHYGEQFARHWLDVVRYADTSGFANDYDRGNAWRYRDYVVRSFNEDKPYDQFIVEQIAGDELRPDDPETLVAVGFLRMGPWELTGMEVAKIARQRFLDDVTDSVGQVFLAHPLQCARCHDHKFDPVPTRDYYRVQAVFATTQLAERSAPFLREENTSGFAEREYLLGRQRHFQSVLAELEKKEEAAARKWCADRGFEYVARNQGLRQGIPEDRLPPKHAGFSVEDFGVERIARKGLERLRWELDRYEPYSLSVYSGPTPPLKSVIAPQRMPADPLASGAAEQTAILAGGDPFSPTIPVTPGVLSAVALFAMDHAEHLDTPVPDSIAGRRLALAHWIASPHNPLTARVIANRIWQWHFGRPLAGNPNNFGTTGKKPTHPELLDGLARSLIEHQWSIKSLHRLIMSSQTYQRSGNHPQREMVTEKDPTGVTYSTFQPRRLTAEELRDSMLLVSGELHRAVGGVPVRPEINLEVALQPRQVMGTFAAAWQPSPLPADRHRRSLYSLKIRGLRDPFAEVFNEPSADFSCEAREVSTVTPQVFSLFNGKASYDRALAFAIDLQAQATPRAAVIHRAFLSAYGRPPSADEVSLCIRHWSQMTDRHRSLQFSTNPVPTEIVREAVEENTGEKFHFVESLEFAQNFQPDPDFAGAGPETRGLAELCLVLFNSNEYCFVY